MDVKITDKNKNSLMKRTEVFCEVSHDGESTPRREDIRKNVSGQMNVKEDKVVLVSLYSQYASGSKAVLHIYSNEKDMISNEKKHLLLRNKLIKSGEEEEAVPEAEAAPVEPTAPKPEEKTEGKKDGKEEERSQSKGEKSPDEKADK